MATDVRFEWLETRALVAAMEDDQPELDRIASELRGHERRALTKALNRVYNALVAAERGRDASVDDEPRSEFEMLALRECAEGRHRFPILRSNGTACFICGAEPEAAREIRRHDDGR